MSEWPCNTPGIPDHLFLRAEGVPMTKQEIRAVSISKLRPGPGSTVIDIGAGTGTVCVECALMGCKVVYGVDNNDKAVHIFKENIKKFGLHNVVPVQGDAPGVLEDLPAADRVFIGGSGGNMESILDKVYEKLMPGGRLVVNSVTLENGPKVLEFFKRYEFNDIDICSMNVSRAVPRGRVYMWQPLSPVQVMSAQKREGEMENG